MARLAWLAPRVAAQLMFSRTAHTDLNAHLGYMDRVREFHEELKTFFHPLVFAERRRGQEDYRTFRISPHVARVDGRRARPVGGTELEPVANDPPGGTRLPYRAADAHLTKRSGRNAGSPLKKNLPCPFSHSSRFAPLSSPTRHTTSTMLVAENLAKRFNGALDADALPFAVARGELFALRVPVGTARPPRSATPWFLTPDSGRVRVSDLDDQTEPPKSLSFTAVVSLWLASMRGGSQRRPE